VSKELLPSSAISQLNKAETQAIHHISFFHMLGKLERTGLSCLNVPLFPVTEFNKQLDSIQALKNMNDHTSKLRFIM
jgi:hypothetical protein